MHAGAKFQLSSVYAHPQAALHLLNISIIIFFITWNILYQDPGTLITQLIAEKAQHKL